MTELGDNGAGVVSGGGEPIRSYQGIFNPDRRLYAIEGHPLPVPGGVPMGWLGYASGTLVGVLALGAHSPVVTIVAAVAAGVLGLGAGGRSGALVVALLAAAGIELGGWLIAQLDWPMRLVVIPGAVATLATQATPDGRRAHRFAVSWLGLRAAPRRQSLGRALAQHPGEADRLSWALWVAPDHRAPGLRPGIVSGPAVMKFAAPVEARHRRRRVRISQLGWRPRRGSIVHTLTVAKGERVEVKP